MCVCVRVRGRERETEKVHMTFSVEVVNHDTALLGLLWITNSIVADGSRLVEMNCLGLQYSE